VRVTCQECGCVIHVIPERQLIESSAFFDADELGLDPEEDANAQFPLQHQPGCEWTE